MRPQRASEQSALAIGRKHRLLGQRLGMRIMAEPARCIGRRFIDAALIATLECHTRAARVHESANAVPAAAFNDELGSERVRLVVMPPRSPDAGDTADVEDRLDSLAGRARALALAQIALNDFDAEPPQLLRFPATI